MFPFDTSDQLGDHNVETGIMIWCLLLSFYNGYNLLYAVYHSQ